MLSEDEIRILNTPIRDLSADERIIALAISDKTASENWAESREYSKSLKISILDKDKLLANGVLSPLDMKTAFHNRRDYADHRKRNRCVEVGNDFNNSTKKKRQIEGDFDCRAELSQATHQIMEKYGH